MQPSSPVLLLTPPKVVSSYLPNISQPSLLNLTFIAYYQEFPGLQAWLHLCLKGGFYEHLANLYFLENVWVGFSALGSTYRYIGVILPNIEFLMSAEFLKGNYFTSLSFVLQDLAAVAGSTINKSHGAP